MIVHTDFTIDFANFWNLLSALSSVTMAVLAVLLYKSWKDQAVYPDKWKLKRDALKVLNKFNRRWSDLIDEYNKTYGYANGFRDVKYVNINMPVFKEIIENLRADWGELCALEVELNDLFDIESTYKISSIEHYLRNLYSSCDAFSELRFNLMKSFEVVTKDTLPEYYNQLGEEFFEKPDYSIDGPWSAGSLRNGKSEDFRPHIDAILRDYYEKLRKT